MENIFELLKSSLLLYFRDKGRGTLFSYTQLMASLYGVYTEADGTVDRRLTLAESQSPSIFAAVLCCPDHLLCNVLKAHTQASLCSSTSKSHCLGLTPMPFFSKFLLSVPPPPY